MLRLPGEEDELIECPYDKAHMIRRVRMQQHIIKCRRNHTLAEYSDCPFDVTHVVPKMELNFHVKTCPQRKYFELFRQQEEMTGKENTEENNHTQYTPRNLGKIMEASENWDEDPEVPSYNPSKYAQSAPVLRLPVDMTPNERKVFRKAERERLKSFKKAD